MIKQESRSEDKVYGENNSQVPIILKNEIHTHVLVDNVKTIVLGGIFRESELEQETKAPLLGDIPSWADYSSELSLAIKKMSC